MYYFCSLVAQMVKRLSINAGDLGSIPGLVRFPEEGNGNPLQYSCLENPMDRGAWCRLLFMGLQRVGHDWVISLHFCSASFLLCFFQSVLSFCALSFPWFWHTSQLHLVLSDVFSWWGHDYGFGGTIWHRHVLHIPWYKGIQAINICYH